MDALGVSNPKNSLAFENILLRPRASLIHRTPNFVGNRMQNYLSGRGVNKGNNDILGQTLNTLQEMRKAFGVNTLREFFMNMRRTLQLMLSRETVFDNSAKFGNLKIPEAHSRNGG